MFDGAREGTASGAGCERAPGGPSSNAAGQRAAVSSARSGRGYGSLRRRSDFNQVYRTGKRRRVGGIVVITARGRRGPPHVGVVVGRKVGTAVERNRTKRRLREALRRVPLEADTAYIVIASAEAGEAAFARLVDWLRAAVGSGTAATEEEA